MSYKSDLNLKKKTELIDIIIRKDKVEISLKNELEEKNNKVDELKKAANKCADEVKAYANKNATIIKEKDELKSKMNTMQVELEDRMALINQLESTKAKYIIACVCLVAIAIIGWIV